MPQWYHFSVTHRWVPFVLIQLCIHTFLVNENIDLFPTMTLPCSVLSCDDHHISACTGCWYCCRLWSPLRCPSWYRHNLLPRLRHSNHQPDVWTYDINWIEDIVSLENWIQWLDRRTDCATMRITSQHNRVPPRWLWSVSFRPIAIPHRWLHHTNATQSQCQMDDGQRCVPVRNM